MTYFDSITRRLAAGWTRWYTAGLPATARTERRLEIKSDVAEHAITRGAEGWGPRRIAAERLSRTWRGAWADLRWRRSMISPCRGGESPNQTLWLLREWPTFAGLALAGAYVLFGLYVLGAGALQDVPLLRLFESDDAAGPASGGVVVVGLGGLVAVAACARLLRSLIADCTLLIAGGFALPFFWMVFPTVLGLFAIAGAVTDLTRQSEAPAPSRTEPREPA